MRRSLPPRLRKGGYGFGYRYMCRFFAMQWVQALRRYKYAMRLDEDVWVHRMVDVLAPLRESPEQVATVAVISSLHRRYIALQSPLRESPEQVATLVGTPPRTRA